MKNYIIHIISIFLLLITVDCPMFAQDDIKSKARIDVTYFNMDVNERYLRIKVTTKIDRKHQAVAGVEIDIYLDTISKAAKLGSTTMNADGVNLFVLPSSFFNALDTLSEFTFFCTLTDHPTLEDKEADLFIKNIEIKTEYIDQDTLRWIRALIFGKDDLGILIPLEDVDVLFFVTRPFNMLPISESIMTDEEGKATIQFPNDLPGDATGHLTAVVKIDDHDDYGTIEKREIIQWGIPTSFDDISVKRSLWAAGANAPIPLLLLTNILIAVVWGIIFYIVYKIYHLSKI